VSSFDRDYHTRSTDPEGDEGAMDPRQSDGQPNVSPPQPASTDQRPMERAPWEASGSDRPPALPAAQSAPWQQSEAPWTQTPPPWQRPPVQQRAAWESSHEPPHPADTWAASLPAPAATAAQPEPAEAADGPVGIEVPPWDAPPAFAFDQPFDDDPYDAFAPLATDIQPAAAGIRARATAVVAEPARPAPPMDRSRSSSSVFGDMLSRTPAAGTGEAWPPAPQQAQPPELPAAPASLADAWPEEDPGQHNGWGELASEADSGAAAEEVQDADENEQRFEARAAAAPDPVEWPPVPTDFPPPEFAAPHDVRQQAHDPLTWPPIPTDVLRVPDLGTSVPRVVDTHAPAAAGGLPEAWVDDESAAPPSAVEDQFSAQPVEASWPAEVAEPQPAAAAEPQVAAAAEPSWSEEAGSTAPAGAAAWADQPHAFWPAEEPGFSSDTESPATNEHAAPPELAPADRPQAEATAETDWVVFEPPLPPEADADSESWEAHWAQPQFAPAEIASERPAAPDALAGFAPDDEPATAPQERAFAPIEQPDAGTWSEPEAREPQRGAIFARFAEQAATDAEPALGAAHGRVAAGAGSATAERQPVSGSARAAEAADDLWFLDSPADEARAASESEAAEAAPSSVQTMILVVLVGLAVVALVVLFLALFTSFFSGV
jgi:hypothetical protein